MSRRQSAELVNRRAARWTSARVDERSATSATTKSSASRAAAGSAAVSRVTVVTSSASGTATGMRCEAIEGPEN